MQRRSAWCSFQLVAKIVAAVADADADADTGIVIISVTEGSDYK